jgi:hypothetical protein
MNKKTPDVKSRSRPANSSENRPKRDPWGCMAGTITIMADVELTAPTEDWKAEMVSSNE